MSEENKPIEVQLSVAEKENRARLLGRLASLTKPKTARSTQINELGWQSSWNSTWNSTWDSRGS